jgi:hypothetical protein
MKETRIEVEAKHREVVLKLIQELREYVDTLEESPALSSVPRYTERELLAAANRTNLSITMPSAIEEMKQPFGACSPLGHFVPVWSEAEIFQALRECHILESSILDLLQCLRGLLDEEE